jgi:hypothetical protein
VYEEDEIKEGEGGVDILSANMIGQGQAIPPELRTTTPYLTKYERARCRSV